MKGHKATKRLQDQGQKMHHLDCGVERTEDLEEWWLLMIQVDFEVVIVSLFV